MRQNDANTLRLAITEVAREAIRRGDRSHTVVLAEQRVFRMVCAIMAKEREEAARSKEETT